MCVQTYFEALHRIPEYSEKESKTSAYIFQALQNTGYSPVRIAETGVYADLVIEENAPWLLLRADIDALPIQEENTQPYCSVHAGFMHACGHDAHSAMLLEAARILKSKDVPQNIRFLFQPAEETTKGASKMLQSGVLPASVSACFAVHVWPGIEKGTIATAAGAMMASSDVFRIRITGKSVHCAQSTSGKDALRTAVDIASSIYEAGEELRQKDTILFCGSIHSGDSHNIVPDRAELYGTVRTFSEVEREKCRERLQTICHTAAKKQGTVSEILWDGGCSPVFCDEKIIQTLQEICPEIRTNAVRTYAAEDFAEYLKYVPGAMLWLGAGNIPPLHSKDFYVPSDILPIGVSFWCKIAMQKWETV